MLCSLPKTYCDALPVIDRESIHFESVFWETWSSPLSAFDLSMEVSHPALSLVQVDPLQVIFSIFRFIWNTVQEVKESKQQLITLGDTVGQLLATLNAEYQAGRLKPEETTAELASLAKYVRC